MSKADLRKQPAQVAAMFDEVSTHYDRTNTVLSMGNAALWRQATTRAVGPRAGETILDIAAGTGTSSASLARNGARVVAADFSEGMIEVGRRRQADNPFITFEQADATALPFEDDTFDAVTISFGLRNIVDPRAALAEFYRVTKPGGRVVICEFSRPPAALIRAGYGAYLRYAMPVLARAASSNPAAYEYLMESIEAWPSQPALASWLRETGYNRVAWRNLTAGIVALHRGWKPATETTVSAAEKTRAAAPAAGTTSDPKAAPAKDDSQAPAKSDADAAPSDRSEASPATPSPAQAGATKKPAAAATTGSTGSASRAENADNTKSGTAEPGTAKTGTAKAGGAKADAAQSDFADASTPPSAPKKGTPKSGAAKSGAAKSGAAKSGAAKSGAAKSGAAKSGAAKSGAAKPGAANADTQHANAKPSSAPKTSSPKTATAEAGPTKPRSSKPATPKPTTPKPTTPKPSAPPSASAESAARQPGAQASRSGSEVGSEDSSSAVPPEGE